MARPRDDDAFDQLVRVHFHQRAVFEVPGSDSSALQITYLGFGESLGTKTTSSQSGSLLRRGRASWIS